MRQSTSGQKVSSRAGATAVEFAIVAPIFFLIMLASFEFSRLNVIRHTADNAAYEAARHAMVPGATALTRTPRSASASAITRVSWLMPPLLTL